MENDTDKLIQDQWNSLPPEIKEALSRVPWKDRARDIGKREGLSAEQADSFETEVMLILYGFTQPEGFASSLVTELGVGEEQAERLVKLVANEIIADIEKQYGTAEPRTSDTPTPSAAPAEDTGLLNIPPEILAKQIKMPTEPVKKLPEVAPRILPKILPNEVAHEVPHIDTPAPQPVATTAAPAPEPKPVEPVPTAAPTTEPSTPKSIVEEKLSGVTIAESQAKAAAYPQGTDPYREPLA